VNIAAMDLKHRFHLWTLLGPCFVLLTLTLLTLQPAGNHLYLPYLALIGLPVCWKWELKGLVAVLILLSVVLFYRHTAIPSHLFDWELGLCLSLGLGFAITALSRHELSPLFQTLPVEKLDTKELEALRTENEKLGQALQVSKNELEATRTTHEKKLQELMAKLQENAQKQEKLAEFQNQAKLLLYNYQDKEKSLKEKCQDYKTRVEEQQNQIQTLQTQISELEKPAVVVKGDHWQDWRRAEGLYQQLREQFDLKQEELDRARQERFQIQEEYTQLKMDHEELTIYGRDPFNKYLENYISQLEATLERQDNEICSLEAIATVFAQPLR
jgi:uncharacterized protein YqgV (UPF0045/DUF77 family)